MLATDFCLRFAAPAFDGMPQLQSLGATVPAAVLAEWTRQISAAYPELVRSPTDQVIRLQPRSRHLPEEYTVEVCPLEAHQRVHELILRPVGIPPRAESVPETMPLVVDAEPPRPVVAGVELSPGASESLAAAAGWSRGLACDLRALLAGVDLSAEEQAVLAGCFARFDLLSEQPSSALALVLFAGFCDRLASLATAEGRHRDAEINTAVSQLLDELAGGLLRHQPGRLTPAAADDRLPRVTQLVALLWKRVTGTAASPVYRAAPRLQHPA